MTVHQEPYLRSLGRLEGRNRPRNRCCAILWRHYVREAAEGLGRHRTLVATRAVCAKARSLVCGACSTIRDVYEPKRVSIARCQTACLDSRADASRSRTQEPIASYRLLSRTNWLLLAACLPISERTQHRCAGDHQRAADHKSSDLLLHDHSSLRFRASPL